MLEIYLETTDIANQGVIYDGGGGEADCVGLSWKVRSVVNRCLF